MNKQQLQNFVFSIRVWFTEMLFAQLFLTLFSLPILLWWGLPLSALTIVGNIVFNPWIGIFLLCSTLLFFCLLVGIPPTPFVWVLEKISDIWLWLISKGTPHALVAFPCMPVAVLMGINMCSLMIMYKFRMQPFRGSVALSCLLLGIVVFGKLYIVPSKVSLELPYGGNHLVLVAENGKSCLIDEHGLLRRGSHNDSWVDFTLRTQLIKVLGRSSCDILFIVHPTVKRLQVALDIARKIKASWVVFPVQRCSGNIDALMVPAEITLRGIPESELARISTKQGMCVQKLWYSIIKNTTQEKVRF